MGYSTPALVQMAVSMLRRVRCCPGFVRILARPPTRQIWMLSNADQHRRTRLLKLPLRWRQQTVVKSRQREYSQHPYVSGMSCSIQVRRDLCRYCQCRMSETPSNSGKCNVEKNHMRGRAARVCRMRVPTTDSIRATGASRLLRLLATGPFRTNELDPGERHFNQYRTQSYIRFSRRALNICRLQVA
ncbi:hypothetical protein OI25_5345 [Paraburkholderia fungorum]|uniref:Secreted protein n=1 Tax=Paraburkholderia fungorum TaxID=134537 RepID=A0AAU8TKS9_9BURK|nr:hypothetical protein OI25_5345 [Paraburkholderia fungorum]PRZ55307.1 hypothetical protein BX589_104205 [Paraburkholderia fungorum]